ncbi:MAG TPA: ABC transporter permease [Paludibacter sp.]|nr:ABC transporter permease [Paludibacter sp.]
MSDKKSTYSARSVLSGIWHNFIHELKTTFSDRGVVIMFMVGPLVYPLLYCGLYFNETLVDVPVGIVDNSQSQLSHQIARNIDATQNLAVHGHYTSLQEARKAFENGEIHGVVFIPKDLNHKIHNNEQVVLSVYSDISSFMYYRSIYQSCTYSILGLSKKIQVQRLNAAGITGENAIAAADPVRYQNISLFNAGGGFASFLLPAIMVLILFQTLFLGITMLAGTSREENRFHVLVSASIHRGGIFRVITGKGALYFLIYSVWVFYALGIMPHVFNLPHIGNPVDILKLMIPFLLATIFFSMTVSVFIPNRETSIILFMFMSIILLFMSGITWPQSNIGNFWKTFAWIFPSTQGIQGYIKINTMSANLHHVRYEYVSLWIQTAIYFVSTFLAYRWQIRKSRKKQLLKELTQDIA